MIHTDPITAPSYSPDISKSESQLRNEVQETVTSLIGDLFHTSYDTSALTVQQLFDLERSALLFAHTMGDEFIADYGLDLIMNRLTHGDEIILGELDPDIIAFGLALQFGKRLGGHAGGLDYQTGIATGIGDEVQTYKQDTKYRNYCLYIQSKDEVAMFEITSVPRGDDVRHFVWGLDWKRLPENSENEGKFASARRATQEVINNGGRRVRLEGSKKSPIRKGRVAQGVAALVLHV